MSLSHADKAAAFAALHTPGDPLVLFNAWDAGSARAVAKAGAKAIASGSHSVAEANGYSDGEQTPVDIVLANAARMAAAVDLPVTIDFERGYGEAPAAAGERAARLLETGIVGVNIEDGLHGEGRLTDAADQAKRLEAIAAARSGGVGLWVNARTDVFLVAPPEKHGDLIDAALDRAKAYADAGAHSLFAPGLVNLALIEQLCAASPLPVNIMAAKSGPAVSDCAAAGVARVSYGGYPWALAMKALKDAAAIVFGR